MRRWCAVISVFACCLSPGAVRAQSIVGNARTVLAAVVNAQGQPVVDVSLDDFVVSEGTASREVLDVHVADYPVALVLDDRPALEASLPAVRAAARRFIQRVGERPVALLRLTGGQATIASLDDDRAVVLERLNALTTPGTEVPAPLDTVARAASLLAETGAPFSAVVVIAAGPVDASALVRGELLPRIIESGAAVHVVQAQAPEPDAEPTTDQEPVESDLLRVIADQSHGQFTAIFSTVSFSAALDRLADRLAIEMMVQYLAPVGPRTGDVRVGVRMPGARVIGLGVK